MTSSFNSIAVGDELVPLVFGPISRHTLALYCGGSGDHNPIHVDLDFARLAGHDDVFAHGMLSMAVLARLITAWVPQQNIRDYSVRFTSITPVNATVTCLGKIADLFEVDGVPHARLDVMTRIDDGSVTLAGSTTVVVPSDLSNWRI